MSPIAKPCPFCGYTDNEVIGELVWVHAHSSIKDSDCCMRGMNIPVELWNRRPNPETQPVAWMYKDKVSPRATPQLLLKRHDVYSTHPEMIEIPLYAHPSPQPEAATIDALSSMAAKFREMAETFDTDQKKTDYIECASMLEHSSEHAGEQGWVMVPREPTEAMVNAAYKSTIITFDAVIRIYKIMLAAAPDSAGEK